MNPQELNRQIRAKLTGIGRKHPSAAAGIVEVIQLLDELTAHIDSGPGTGTDQASKPNRKTPKIYVCEQRADGRHLAEHRDGGKQPFLVHEDVYNAFVHAMAKSKQPEPFDDVLARAAKIYKSEIPIYQGRTVTRFWLSREPALIRKAGRAYCPASLSRFAAQARKAFRDLPTE